MWLSSYLPTLISSAITVASFGCSIWLWTLPPDRLDTLTAAALTVTGVCFAALMLAYSLRVRRADYYTWLGNRYMKASLRMAEAGDHAGASDFEARSDRAMDRAGDEADRAWEDSLRLVTEIPKIWKQVSNVSTNTRPSD